MDWVYTAISAILLFWHAVWDKVVPKAAVVGTNWQWVLAIMCLVITIRVILFPIFVKQIKSQRAMQALQPKVKELQAKHKDDKETMQKELMQLYRTEKANPLMGCLPMVLQIPVFWGLYHVLQHLNPLKHTDKTLYGWTVTQFTSAANAKLFQVPLAAKFQSSDKELLLLGATGTTGVKVVAAVLVIMMMSTTFLSSRQMILKTGWSEDPQQKMMQRLMLYGFPLSILFYGWTIPIGVIIYWVVQNLFSLGQQHWVLSKYPPPNMNVNGKVAPPKPSTTGSILRRRVKNEPAPAAPVVDTKALAPKVGAKPINPKKGAKRQTG
jgi:YidC/Oxa1 family membrane protein insertase